MGMAELLGYQQQLHEGICPRKMRDAKLMGMQGDGIGPLIDYEAVTCDADCPGASEVVVEVSRRRYIIAGTLVVHEQVQTICPQADSLQTP